MQIWKAVRASAALAMGLAAASVILSPRALADVHEDLLTLLEGPRPTRQFENAAFAITPVRYFYRDRGYVAAWTSAGGDSGLNETGRAIAETLEAASADGLDPAAYRISDGLKGAPLELALTIAIARYARDVRSGRTEPNKVDSELFLSRTGDDIASLLRNVATTADVRNFLGTLAPNAKEYRALRTALARYNAIAKSGGWQPVPATQTIKPGYQGPAVTALWRRLRATGDIDAATSESETYDGALVEAVVRFQERHGLQADGAVGAMTFAALNRTIIQRIRQIEINLERWRWMPDDLGERHVFVNLAGFDLRAVRRGETVVAMPVIIGRPYRRTPVFSDRITYLELNPGWWVPHSIATQDLLPKFRNDPTYFVKNGFQLLPPGGAAPPVDPATVAWHRYGPKNFPFLLRQLPGPANALGQIKFMFPNKFAVYLHDTPARDLFRSGIRTFSSGCIRVENPMALARFLLADDLTWNADRLHREVETGKTTVIRLHDAVPVHLSYLTAWVTEDGRVHFRNDVYGRDARLEAAIYDNKTR